VGYDEDLNQAVKIAVEQTVHRLSTQSIGLQAIFVKPGLHRLRGQPIPCLPRYISDYNTAIT
jgi:hypothetical protein